MTMIVARYILDVLSDTDHQHQSKSGMIIDSNELHWRFREYAETTDHKYNKPTLDIFLNHNEFTDATDSSSYEGVVRCSPFLMIVDNYASDNEMYYDIKMAIYMTNNNKDAVDTAYIHVKLLQYLCTTTKHIDYREKMYEHLLETVATRLDNSRLYSLLRLLSVTEFRSFDDNITKILFGNENVKDDAIHCFIVALACFSCTFTFAKIPLDHLLIAVNIGSNASAVAKLTGEMIGARYGSDAVIPSVYENVEGLEEIANLVTTMPPEADMSDV